MTWSAGSSWRRTLAPASTAAGGMGPAEHVRLVAMMRQSPLRPGPMPERPVTGAHLGTSQSAGPPDLIVGSGDHAQAGSVVAASCALY